MFPVPATYFRQPLPHVIGATVSEYLWADLTPFEPSAALLLVELAYLCCRGDQACSSFRLQPTWVWVSPCVGSLAVCHAANRVLSPVSEWEFEGPPKFLTLLYTHATL